MRFAIIVYLAFSNGGYDLIVRGQVGIAVWWIVLLGALTGILPTRFGAGGWAAIGLLAGFALWTGVATSWSESAERSVAELGRVAAYLGVLVLALALQTRGAARHTINGLACAIGLVTVLAVLSRLHPQWFPANDHFQFLGEVSGRKLSYPLNYWNALAAFAAIGVPLLLGVALQARTLAGRAVAAATLPLSALCVYLTISRGGALAVALGIVVFVAFVPRRLEALGTLLVAGAGSALLLAAVSGRDELLDGEHTATAIGQGTAILWLAVVVCGAVALAQVALVLALRGRRRRPRPPRAPRAVLMRVIGAALVIAVVGVAAGLPARATDQWREFRAPVGTVAVGAENDVFSRLSGVNSGGRYQYWQSALDANATDRWKGIGPGTFEYWWARSGTTMGFIRDAHTLYFETLAEAGIVGFALLAGLFGLLLVAAVRRMLRGDPDLKIWIAAAAGGLAAFMTSAAVEWVWEVGAIACAMLLLAAVILAGRETDAPRTSRAQRVVLVVLAVASLGVIAVPMAAELALRDSRAAASAGRVADALQDARSAQRLQPYAATPALQRALVLEQAGALADAASSARTATSREPTNWRTWFVLARIEARRGESATGVAALREARRLNPRSQVVDGG